MLPAITLDSSTNRKSQPCSGRGVTKSLISGHIQRKVATILFSLTPSALPTELSRLAKAHNNANVLVMPARFISYQMATTILNKWLDTDFEGGRHQRRIDKIPLSK